MAVRLLGAIDPAVAARVAAAVDDGALASLGDLPRAGLEVVEVVTQDEYTHDVVTRGWGAAYLCFDTT